MRIRVLRRPKHTSVDGLQLDGFRPGNLYDVGTLLGCLFLAERWAEPVVIEEPALLAPMGNTARGATRGPLTTKPVSPKCFRPTDNFVAAAELRRGNRVRLRR